MKQKKSYWRFVNFTKLEKHIKEEKYMLTEEQKKEIENLYNYYWELYLKQQEEDADKKLYLGKLSGMDDVLSCLGYKTKMKYGLVKKEEE